MPAANASRVQLSLGVSLRVSLESGRQLSERTFHADEWLDFPLFSSARRVRNRSELFANYLHTERA